MGTGGGGGGGSAGLRPWLTAVGRVAVSVAVSVAVGCMTDFCEGWNWRVFCLENA